MQESKFEGRRFLWLIGIQVVACCLFAGGHSFGLVQLNDLPGPFQPESSESIDSAEERPEFQDQDVSKRLAELNEAIEKNPKNPFLRLQRASLFKQTGAFQRLWEDVETAIELDSNNSWNHLMAASIVVNLNPERAVEFCNRAIELNPTMTEAYVRRGMAHFLLENYELAFLDLEIVLAKAPQHAEANSQMGAVYAKQGKYKEAVDYLNRSIETSPSFQAVFDRAYCHRLLGNIDQSIEDYSWAIKLNPGSLDAYCERGQVFQMAGSYASALADFQTCYNAIPENDAAALQLAWLLATCPDDEIRDNTRALELAERSCDPYSCQQAEPLHVLAAAYADQGATAKAIEMLNRANSLSHFSPAFRNDGLRRLQTVSAGEPIREAKQPLRILPREVQEVPRSVTLNEALQVPPEILGKSYLQLRTLELLADIAAAGANIHSELDGSPLFIGPENAQIAKKRIEERIAVCRAAIAKRGFQSLAPAYTVEVDGQCNEWGFSDRPFLVEQDDFDVYLTQGTSRHMGVAIESEVIFRHDLETSWYFRGTIKEGAIEILTPNSPGLWFAASERCGIKMHPSKIEGEEWAYAFLGRSEAHLGYDDPRSALHDLDRAIALSPTSPFYLRKASVLAMTPDDECRDPVEALRLVQLAKDVVESNELETELAADSISAAALAAKGDFDKAIIYLEKVIDRAPEYLVPILEERLRKFRAGKAVHEDLEQAIFESS